MKKYQFLTEGFLIFVFGLNIKGMTQKDLAQRLGKTETEVSRWLSGTHNLTLSTICKISAALGEDIITVPRQS